MSRKPAKTPLLLGIEAGGTRSVAILADLDGNFLQRLEAGPANLKLVSDTQLCHHLRTFACGFPRPAALGIGMAGARTEADRDRVRAAVVKVWGDLPCRVTADLETALAAAGEDREAVAQVLVLSGTGSCCFGHRRSGESTRVGGWGHILGDEGSGFDIALRAMRAVIAAFDRTGGWPRLGTRLLRKLLLNEPNDIVGWLQTAPKSEVARLAPEVFSAWHSGDRIAQLVVREAAQALVRDALACVGKLALRRERVRFVLAGSVLLRQPKFAALVSTALRKTRPGCTVAALKRESAWGAVELAKNAMAGVVGNSGTSNTPHRASNIQGGETVPSSERASGLVPVATKLPATEQRNPRSLCLDKLSVSAAVRLMIMEDRRITSALLREERAIARAIGVIVGTLRRRGRLFYVGAGTSGRLGVLDASECPPTFRTPPDQVQGIIAGGPAALWEAVEGAEDDFESGARAVEFRGVARRDTVVGIAASGRTPFVWGALQAALRRGASTVLVCFNPHLRFCAGARPEVVIAPQVGPEILTGSTRLKAGTATKTILNLFTTIAMVRLGKVVSNLMVDVNPTNAKLRDRAVRIVRQLTAADETTAQATLEQTGWVVKKAVRRLTRKSIPGSFRPAPPATRNARR